MTLFNNSSKNTYLLLACIYITIGALWQTGKNKSTGNHTLLSVKSRSAGQGQATVEQADCSKTYSF